MNLGSISIRNRKNREIVRKSKFRKNYGNHYVFCDSAELRQMITIWTNQTGGKFEDFRKILKLVGLATSVKLVELNEEENYFNCIFHKEIIKISLHLRCEENKYSEIWITQENDTYKYRVEFLPKTSAKLMIRETKQNGKILSCFYSEYFYHLQLVFDEVHTLKATIQKPSVDSRSSEKLEPFIPKNHKEIEDYVLGLNAFMEISEVYKSLVEFLSFSDEDICYGENIIIASM